MGRMRIAYAFFFIYFFFPNKKNLQITGQVFPDRLPTTEFPWLYPTILLTELF
jgi:hypothetical protein